MTNNKKFGNMVVDIFSHGRKFGTLTMQLWQPAIVQTLINYMSDPDIELRISYEPAS